MKPNSLSILFPWQDRVTYRQVPPETWHDLGLDAIVEKVAAKPQEIPLLERVMTSLTADPEVCRFRADVFADLSRHPEIRDRLMKLLDRVKMFYDYGVVSRHAGDEAGIWDLMHRLEEYRDYIVSVEEIRECLSGADLRSEGLITLRETIIGIYESNGFAALRKDVEELRVNASGVRSVTVGINVNERFEAINMGLVAVNAKPFTRSGVLKHFITAVNPRDEISPEAEWSGSMNYQPASPPLGFTDGMNYLVEAGAVLRNPIIGMTMASIPRDDGSSEVPRQFDSAATTLLTRLVRHLREVLGKYINLSVRDISGLIPELVFYVRWAEYLDRLKQAGWHFCKPEAGTPEGGSGMRAEGFYNLKLIGSVAPGQAVLNDLRFDGEKRVYVLTGANRGGKTTVTQAVGQLFMLAQCGISVPANVFVFDPADLVLAHFPADEDRTLDLGRLGEECRRFRELYDMSSGKSLILLNETFSTTSFEEGYYIAVDSLRAILQKGARTIYNTHMHKLAYDLDTAVNIAAADNQKTPGKAVSLVSESKDGTATFRIRIAPPEGKSFARGIAEKYGVTYEDLTGSRTPRAPGSSS